MYINSIWEIKKKKKEKVRKRDNLKNTHKTIQNIYPASNVERHELQNYYYKFTWRDIIIIAATITI